LSQSDSNGTMAAHFLKVFFLKWKVFERIAQAANLCPTLLNAAGSGCTQLGNSVDLTYNGCSFADSSASYSGILEFSLSEGASITCGIFPNTSTLADNQSIQRQFVSSGGVPGSAVYAGVSGDTTSIDESSINLTNFDNQTVVAIIGSAYGSQVVFDGAGNRKRIIVRERVYSTSFDITLDGTMNITDSTGVREVNGSVTVYNNKLKIVGTSTFSKVLYTNMGCLPVGGTISTVYAAGATVSPTGAGTAYVGKREIISFNSDATAVFTDINGTTTNIFLTHCF
ncbi:MAG: hypothetical protein ACXWQQ_09895, partial [Pseudobdellovibrio sp.]